MAELFAIYYVGVIVLAIAFVATYRFGNGEKSLEDTREVFDSIGPASIFVCIFLWPLALSLHIAYALYKKGKA